MADCTHSDWVAFYEDMTVNPPQFKAYCQRCKMETGWWPSRTHAERSFFLASGPDTQQEKSP